MNWKKLLAFPAWNEEKLEWKYGRVLLALECILCTLLLFSVCFNNNVWWDESYTYDMVANHGWGEILLRTAKDVHPPLYYLITKLFTVFGGTSLLTMKAASIFANICMMWLACTTVYRRFGLKASALLVFLCCFAPQMAFFAVQLRMYSWSAFFVMGSAVYGYEVLAEGKRKDWICFVLLSLGAAYSVYFACISVAFIYVLLFFMLCISGGHDGDVRKRIREYFLAGVATVAGYLPWLIMFLVVTFGGLESFHESPDEHSFWELFAYGLDNRIVWSVAIYGVMLAVAVLGLWIFKRPVEALQRKHQKACRLYWTLLLLAPAWTFIIGKIMTSMAQRRLIYRYIAPSMIVLWIVAAVGISLYRNRLFYVAMALAVLMGFYNYRYVYEDEYYVAPLVHETEAFVENQLEPGETVLYELDAFLMMWKYYFPQQDLQDVAAFDVAAHQGESFYFIDAWGGYFDAETVEKYHITREKYGDYGIQSMNFQIDVVTIGYAD